MISERLAEIMEESRKMFIADARKRIQNSILELFDVMIKPDKENKTSVERFFHTIKGSAYTLEYNSIAEIAKVCEEKISNNIEIDKIDNDALIQILNGYAQIWNEIDTIYDKYFGTIAKQPINVQSLMSPLFSQIIEKSNLNVKPGTNILLADEDTIMVDFLEKKLISCGYNVFLSTNSDDIYSVVARKKIDIVILDILLPGKNGFELYKGIRENGFEGIFIFLTAKNLVQDKINALKLGVDDYILKPFNVDELLVRILKLLYLRSNAHDKSVYDNLTDAFTREYFYQQINADMLSFDEKETGFSLIFLDIDDFAIINKNNGFLIGDMILRKFVEIVKDFLQTDQVFRFDGDKFLILLNEIDADRAMYLSNKLSEEIKATQFSNIALNIQFSAGVYTVTSNNMTIEKIVDRLYEVIDRIKSDTKGKILFVPEDSVEIIGKPKILVADDVEIVNHMIKARLEALDCKLYYARDGLEAVTKCRDLRPDLMILDLMMPKMDGFEVCSIVKADPNMKNIRIIVLSSRNKEEDVIKCYKYGVDGYMLKPFSIDELEMRIKKLLKR